jgi:hypothetical protein
MEGWLRDRVGEDPALLGLEDIPKAIRSLFEPRVAPDRFTFAHG